MTPPEQRDLPTLASLVEEMDRFYGVKDFPPLEERIAQLKAMLFRENPAAHLLLAWDHATILGLAAYSFLWPAVGITQSLYLKELYVAEAHRRRGIGKLLMERVCVVATENQCSRIEWTTEQNNTEARRFYADLGFTVNSEKVFYRAEGKEISGSLSVRNSDG